MHISCCVLSNLAAVLLRKSVTLVFVQKQELDDLANKMKQHCPQNLWSMKYYSVFQPLYILHLAFPVLVCKLFYGDNILSCFSQDRTEAFDLFHFSSLIINWCVCIRRVLFWDKKKKGELNYKCTGENRKFLCHKNNLERVLHCWEREEYLPRSDHILKLGFRHILYL